MAISSCSCRSARGSKTTRYEMRLLSPLTQLSGFCFRFCGARQVGDGAFRVGVFGRCSRRGKSSGPPLLKPSLKVERNSAHSQSSAFVVARSCGLNARDRFKDPGAAQRPS
jgi:hypothetical protein